MPAAPFPCPAQVRWTALSMTSYADKRRDVRLNTKEARKRLESGQEMLQGLLNKDLDLLKEVLLAKGEGAAGGSGSGAAARHASISKLVQKKVRGGGRMYMLCGRLQSGPWGVQQQAMCKRQSRLRAAEQSTSGACVCL